LGYQAIHDYGIIGDMNSCALVSRDGSIDWACFPRFDSPSIFAAILDDVKGGRFSIAPVGEYESSQEYARDSTILHTRFTTASGAATVIDFMASARPSQKESPHELIRVVRGAEGTVEMRLVFQPRFDYARAATTLSVERHGVVASHDDERMALVTDLPLTIDAAPDGGPRAIATFTVSAGETIHVTAAYGLARTPSVAAMDCETKLARAHRFSQAIVSKINYTGRWRDEVVRSFLTLHLLIYEPTGSVVAAPTTSLPEFLGGERNWDYRFSWLRDSAWTVGVFYRLGDPHEGKAFVDWIVSQCWLGVENMQVLYGISPDSVLEEQTLGHLEGYERSGPVRIGNDAAFHRQLDVFGEIALSLATYHKYHGLLSDTAWGLMARVADLAAEMWRLPDRGIWEVRGKLQHFVYSKVQCWVALDRASRLAETHGYPGSIERWKKEAAVIHADILANGWSDAKQSFVQAYGTEAIDASALLLPFVGFLPPGDPRIRSTIQRVRQELATGPFVRRYLASETDDGFEDGEGAFFMLSFWLIGGLLAIGDTDEAEAMFDQLLASANHLGLYAEMIDPATGKALGNFPQAFSHIGLIHTARNLNEALTRPDYQEDLLG
jgi:GH15 family glucan-1,4-alpha-glucosidase